MLLSENIRYTSSWEGSKNNESITPSLSLLINNDIFGFDLTGTSNSTRSTEGPNRSNNSWESRINSNWDKIFWPNFQFNYGQTFADDDLKTKVIDVESSHTGITVDWEILILSAFYSYDTNDNKDFVDQSDNTSTIQVARFDTQKSFLDGDLDTTLSYLFSTTTQDFTAKVDDDGFVLLPLTVNQYKGANDYEDQPEDIDWNDDLSSPLPMVMHDESYHLAIETVSDEPDVLYLYTDKDLTDEAHLFQWQVYTSDDGISWTRVTPDASHIYETIRQRFEVTLPAVSQRYTMLVEQLVPTLEDFSIISIEGFKKVVGTVGTTITDKRKTDIQQANASLSWQLSPQLTLSSNVSLEDSTGTNSEYRETNVSGSLLWRLSEFTTSTVNIGESNEERTDLPESMQRNYGLTVSSQILPTLDINSAVTMSHDYEEKEKVNTRINYSFLTSAILYPDLNASFELNYLTNKDDLTDETKKDFSSSLIITARLFPDLTATLDEKYNESRSTHVSRTLESRIFFTWRPADILSVNGNLRKKRENGEGQPVNYSLTIGMAPTPKVQLNMNYTHADKSDAVDVSANWHVNDIFTVYTSAGYQDPSSGDAVTYKCMLTMRY